MAKRQAAKVLTYSEIDWDRPGAGETNAPSPPKALLEQARKTGARRKKIVCGEGGFFMNRSVLPAGFRVPPHLHDHNEMLVVLSGGCVFDDGVGQLGPDDTIVISAFTRYGFTCGDGGMEFLTIRIGEASVEVDA